MKIVKFSAICLLAFSLFNCENKSNYNESVETSVATTEETTPKECGFTVVDSLTSVSFKAFKTSAKVAVGGKFDKVSVTIGASNAQTTKELIESTSFSINTNSTNTTVKDRDLKIINLLFGAMDSTEFITGNIIAVDDTTVSIKLKMNGVEKEVKLSFEENENRIKIWGTIDLLRWNGIDAMTSLSKQCFELHKGADGVSKLWSEVDVEINAKLVSNCE